MEVKHRLHLDKILRETGMIGDTVEVGVASGEFSLDMLKWDLGKHYLVDKFGHIPDIIGDGNYNDEWHLNNYNKTLERIGPYKDRAIILKGMSVDMANKVQDNSIVLVNIDADHTLLGIRSDIKAWWPKLKVGGIMCFHDFLTYPGVNYEVNEFANNNGLELHLLPEDAIKDAGAYIIKK